MTAEPSRTPALPLGHRRGWHRRRGRRGTDPRRRVPRHRHLAARRSSAIALVLVALQGRKGDSAFLVGLVFGIAFYFPHIEWAAVFLGPVPWSALSMLMALWCGLGGMLITWAYRWRPAASGRAASAACCCCPPSSPGSGSRARGDRRRLAVRRILVGAGGVLAVRQPVLAAVRLARRLGRRIRHGVPRRAGDRGRARGRRRSAHRSGCCGAPACALALRAGCVAAVVVACSRSRPGPRCPAAPRPATPTASGSAPCRATPRRATSTRRSNFGDNLRGQLAATQPLYDQDVDVVVWPEGSSDVTRSPTRTPRRRFRRGRRRARRRAARRRHHHRARPGHVDANGDEVYRYFNTSTLWHAGEGQVDYYDKKHPVPFGEYVPDRCVLAAVRARPHRPDRARVHARHHRRGARCRQRQDRRPQRARRHRDLLRHRRRPADDRDGRAGRAGRLRPDQQRRLRAHRRERAAARDRADPGDRDRRASVVNISTVGTSAIVYPDGSVHDQLTWYTAGCHGRRRAAEHDDDARRGRAGVRSSGSSASGRCSVLGLAACSRVAAATLARRRERRSGALAAAGLRGLTATGAKQFEALLQQLFELGAACGARAACPSGCAGPWSRPPRTARGRRRRRSRRPSWPVAATPTPRGSRRRTRTSTSKVVPSSVRYTLFRRDANSTPSSLCRL